MPLVGLSTSRGRGWPSLGVATALALASVGCGASSPAPRSVILIVIDTLRADHLGVYGYERATSPALDRFASRAAVFGRAQATSPWTLPSFGSLFTGQIPSRHAAGLLLDSDNSEFAGLDASAKTLAETLSAAGFATAGVVNNPFLHPNFGLSRGFERWDYVFGKYEQHPRADQIVHWGLRWLDGRDERPFFLMLHFFDPHLPYDPGDPARGRFAEELGGILSLPFAGLGKSNATWNPKRPRVKRFVTAAYDEEILFVDLQLERLFTGLAERGLDEETLVIITADHGEELFDHGGFEHGHTMHHELLRVPLLMAGPGVTPGWIDEPVSLTDVMPTILEALGVAQEGEVHGWSVWSLVTEREPLLERALLAEGTLHGPDRKTLTRWPWKLVLTAGAPAELYDLASDPLELEDLAEASPDRLEALRDELNDVARAASRERISRIPADIDAETRQQLIGLGYLE